MVHKLDLGIEVGDSIAELDLHRVTADIRLLAQEWQGGLELGDGRGDLVGFSDLLQDLLVQRRDFVLLGRRLLDHRGACLAGKHDHRARVVSATLTSCDGASATPCRWRVQKCRLDNKSQLKGRMTIKRPGKLSLKSLSVVTPALAR